MAKFHDMAVQIGGWGMVCESTAKCTLQMGTIILSSSHKLINQNDQKSHFQYIFNSDGKMCDDKLLSKYKMPLMAK